MIRIALFLIALLSVSVVPAEESPAPLLTFEDLVIEAGMVFTSPLGLQPVAVHANPQFLYDRAFATPDGDLEVRYAVRPLERIVVDYQDPHSSAPDPNHMFPLMFQSMVTLLSGGGHSPTREYPPDRAKSKFNADWAAAAVFDVSAEFQTNHKQALVIAIHKNQLADAYSVFLFDDYAAVKDRIDGNLAALSFLP